MTFKKLPTRDGYQTWGAEDALATYVIGFDGKYPERGYSASYKPRGHKTVLIGERFATKADARRAIEDATKMSVRN